MNDRANNNKGDKPCQTVLTTNCRMRIRKRMPIKRKRVIGL